MPEQEHYGTRSGRPAAGPTVTLEGYHRLREIGRGGFAVVYQAWQPAFTRHVAIKVIATVLDAATLKRFERECLAAGALSGHPNIVTVYELGSTGDNRPYIVMEFLEGGSMADRLTSEGPMDWPDVLEAGVKLAGALESAHRTGVLHRDIKPENVLLSRFGEPKLADFGIASVQGRTETRSGTVTASVAHAPPEVLSGRRPSVASDVYSLASTLYMLLDGTAAFVQTDDETILPMLVRIASAPVPDLREKGVPEPVWKLIERGMSKEPGDRPASAVELGRMLQQLQVDADLPVTRLPLEGEPVPQHSRTTPTTDVGATIALAGAATTPEVPSPPDAVARPPGRRRVMVGAAVAVVIAGVVAVGVALSQSGKSPTSTGPTVTTATTATTAGATTPVTAVKAIFEDDFSSSGSGWAQTDNENAKLLYAAGRYRFEVKKPNLRETSDTELEGSAYRKDLTELGDVAVETTAFHDANLDAFYGLTCRKEVGRNTGYVALINPKGSWLLLRVDPEEHILAKGEAPPPGAAPAQSRLRLECSGTAGGPVNVKLFVDGRMIGEAGDATGLPVGAVGLVVTTTSGPAEVQFDDVAVQAL